MLDLLSRPPTAELPEILALDADLIEWMREELDRLQRLAALFWLVWRPFQERGLTEESSLILSATMEQIRTGEGNVSSMNEAHPALIGISSAEFKTWPEQILDPASPIRQMT